MFGELAPQDEVYAAVGAGLVNEVLQGFNATIFAYGQSGTGKTYTMEGPGSASPGGADASASAPQAPSQGGGVDDEEEDEGLIPRAVRHVFGALAGAPPDGWAVKASFLEIYNEELHDLLQPGKARPPVLSSESA